MAARRQSPRPRKPDAGAAPAAAGLPPGTLPGVVVRAYGPYVDVELLDGAAGHDAPSVVLLSTIRGSLRRERRRTDLVAVGDRVEVTPLGNGEGQIEAIAPRQRSLARRARQTDDVEQVILANPDQALFLFAARDPEPHRRMLDRFLVLAESRDLPAIIGINKIDLVAAEEEGALAAALAAFDDYRPLYPLYFVSAATGAGVAELRAALLGKITVVAGPSGVGKSSLLNALDPDRRRAVATISAATGKGRHTTVATVLQRLPDAPGTFIADTPGIRALALHGVERDELDHCFPEFRPHLGGCFYHDCSHLHEPGCAVREAVAAGAIAAARYDSYAALCRGDEE